MPFKIQGTMSHPAFAPDVGQAVKNVFVSEETQKKAAGLIGSLFKKKK